MKVLIIGEGALGIGIGASLFAGGMEVEYLITDSVESAKAIRENGIKRSGMFEEVAAQPGEIKVYDAYEKLPPQSYDYILIASAVSYNEEISARLDHARACRKKDVPIIFFQDGIGVEETFLPYFTDSCCYHARVLTDFEAVSPWESRITAHRDDVLIGSMYRNMLGRVSVIADALDQSGLPTCMDTELDIAVWTKMIWNTVLGPISAVLRRTVGALADSEYSRNIIDILIEEAYSIMDASGKKCEYESPEEFRRFLFKESLPEMRDYRTGMLRAVEEKRSTEVDSIMGTMLRLAGKYGIDCPVSTMLYWELKAIEEEF